LHVIIASSVEMTFEIKSCSLDSLYLNQDIYHKLVMLFHFNQFHIFYNIIWIFLIHYKNFRVYFVSWFFKDIMPYCFIYKPFRVFYMYFRKFNQGVTKLKWTISMIFFWVVWSISFQLSSIRSSKICLSS
jgi:hypothetical protein